MSGERCDGCRFYHWWSTQYSGQCRRYPPKLVDKHADRWPNVGPDDWCGEFEANVEDVVSPLLKDQEGHDEAPHIVNPGC